MFTLKREKQLLSILIILFITLLACAKNKPEFIFPSYPMVLVPGGTFQMGSNDSNSFMPEEFIHEVTLVPFYIAPCEITVKEFAEFILAEKYTTTAEKAGGAFLLKPPVFELIAGGSWKNPGFIQESNEPVVCVSWFDAVIFCNYLSKKYNLTPAYKIGKDSSVVWEKTSNGFRLPTEAEWEFAAGEGKNKRAFTYSGSGNIYEISWIQENSKNRTHPVAQKKPNSLGLYDMTGNAWEWCFDWFGQSYYDESVLENPDGPVDGQCRVSRGGSWVNRPRNSRITQRFSRSPRESFSYQGFRIARSYFPGR